MSKLKDRIKQIDDIQKIIETVPGWNEKVEIRTMTGLERSKVLDAAFINGKLSNEKLFPAIIVASCFDPETGEKLFDESDIAWLMQKNAGAIEFLAQRAIDVSGLSSAMEKQAEKN